jgi:tetratricopeptide (TPR) repeat protein
LLAVRGTNEPSAYDYYLQGRGYLQEFQKPENVESAITVFDRALELDPKYSLVFSGLGEAYWRKYELETDPKWTKPAKDNCRQALLLDENEAQGHICLGLVYDGTGKYGEASKEFQTAVALEPTSDNAIRGLASAYEHLGRMDAAEKTYSAAIAARPNYWRNYNALGALYMDEAHYAQAAEMFSRVTELAPDSFRGFSNLGGAYLSLGSYADAIAAFQESIAIRGTSDAYSNLATAHFDSRQFDDAAQNYKQAISLGDKDYQVWGNLADAYYYSVKRRSEAAAPYSKAITLAKQSLEVNPRDTTVLADIAGYYSMLGERSKAFIYLDRALNESPDQDPNLFFQASLVNNQLGETRMALQWLTRAIKGGYSIATVEQAPALDNLRSNSDFQAVVRNANAGKQ